MHQQMTFPYLNCLHESPWFNGVAGTHTVVQAFYHSGKLDGGVKGQSRPSPSMIGLDGGVKGQSRPSPSMIGLDGGVKGQSRPSPSMINAPAEQAQDTYQHDGEGKQGIHINTTERASKGSSRWKRSK